MLEKNATLMIIQVKENVNVSRNVDMSQIPEER